VAAAAKMVVGAVVVVRPQDVGFLELLHGRRRSMKGCWCG
jgi:hypothetical protein